MKAAARADQDNGNLRAHELEVLKVDSDSWDATVSRHALINAVRYRFGGGWW